MWLGGSVDIKFGSILIFFLFLYLGRFLSGKYHFWEVSDVMWAW